MNYLSAQQLGVLLGIPKKQARDKMVYAWCKNKGLTIDPFYNAKKKDVSGKSLHRDPYPVAMPTDLLAKELNIPALPDMVQDISENYLKRKSTRGYIMNYASSELEKRMSKGAKLPISISIPTDVRSFLKQDVVDEIHAEWKRRLQGWINKGAVVIK